MKITGGASGAVASSSHAACARFRGTDPLITGVTRRALAMKVGYSKGPESSIPLLRWIRAMAFERLIRDSRFASEVVTASVGSLGLARPTAVAVADALIDVSKTEELLKNAHESAIANGTSTLIYQLAVPFVGLEDDDATETRPDFAVVAPKQPDKAGEVDGTWLIIGDAKDYQRIRSNIDDQRLLKGFLQVALGAESASLWTKLPLGMEVHQFGILAVPRNTSLSPTAIIEDLTDHREEVRLRVDERSAEVARFPDDVGKDLPKHLAHLRATYSPASCPSCDMFIYCRAELQRSTDPTDMLIELGVKPETRAQAVGLVDGVTPVGKVARSLRHQIEASITGVAPRSDQRRLDPIGQPGTVNLVLAKSDGASLGVYGVGVQRVTKGGAEPWHVEIFTNPDADETRRSIIKLLGKELSKALAEQSKLNASNPDPIHLVVPDSTTADIIVSIADNIAGKELSRLRWERDKHQGRQAVTYNGEEAVLPPRLPEKDRVAVSFLLEQDRYRTMQSRSSIVDLRATLAALITAGGPSGNSLRLDYLAPWADPNLQPIDHRLHAQAIEKSEHAVGAQLTPTRSNAIHEAFIGKKSGLPRPADPAEYENLIRSEIGYKTEVFDRAASLLESEFEVSNLRQAVRTIEADGQRVWKRRLNLHAFDLVRFGRIPAFARNALVPVLEDDEKFNKQLAVLTNPLTAHDMAQDPGNRELALARVVTTLPLVLEIDSRRIGHEARIVLLHVNHSASVERDDVSIQTLKGSFKMSNMSIGKLTTHDTSPRHFQWDPHNDPGLAEGDDLIVANFSWFSRNTGDSYLNVQRPSLESASASAPKEDCLPESYGDDPTHHQWCCKPHETSESEWSDELASRRERGELNPQAWPPLVDSDAFDVSAANENVPDAANLPRETPPEELSMDDVE